MTTIGGLLFLCRPAAISRLIIAVGVRPTVKAVFGRRLPAHVGEKNSIIVPNGAKDYARAAIISVSVIVRIIATAACFLPRNVFRGFSFVPRLAVLCLAFSGSFGGCFVIPAAAGFSMAADKMPRGDQPPLAAIATTEPNRIAVAAHMTETYNGQAIKTLIRKIFSCRHKEAL